MPSSLAPQAISFPWWFSGQDSVFSGYIPLRETWVQSLGWLDPLEKGMATHSCILAWKNPMDKGAQQDTVYGVAKSWTRLSD